MIGRRINGEQAEHLARFMEANRQSCAFEEAEETGRCDALMVCIGILGLLFVLCLVQFIEVVV